jgi:hypothetical protein
LSFSQDTAAKTGKSKRTVERDTALGDALDDQAGPYGKPAPIDGNPTEPPARPSDREQPGPWVLGEGGP